GSGWSADYKTGMGGPRVGAGLLAWPALPLCYLRPLLPFGAGDFDPDVPTTDLLASSASFRCSSSVGSVLPAHSLTSGSFPAVDSFLNSLPSFRPPFRPSPLPPPPPPAPRTL